uniref:Uncharacterized protein n=1 Tax=Lotharella globosa TaxID=91324 RepID=A0A7S3YRN8_9EUKA
MSLGKPPVASVVSAMPVVAQPILRAHPTTSSNPTPATLSAIPLPTISATPARSPAPASAAAAPSPIRPHTVGSVGAKRKRDAEGLGVGARVGGSSKRPMERRRRRADERHVLRSPGLPSQGEIGIKKVTTTLWDKLRKFLHKLDEDKGARYMDRIRSMPPEEILHKVSAAEEVVQFLNLAEFKELQRCQTLAVLRTNTPPPPPHPSQSSGSGHPPPPLAAATSAPPPLAATSSAPPPLAATTIPPSLATASASPQAAASGPNNLTNSNRTRTPTSRDVDFKTSAKAETKEMKEAEVLSELAALEEACANDVKNVPGVKIAAPAAAAAATSAGNSKAVSATAVKADSSSNAERS